MAVRILDFVLLHWKRIALAALLAVLLLGWKAWSDTMGVPVVKETQVTLPGMPEESALKAVLISDIHVAGPDMPPSRLARIVEQINALEPDIVFIAGDLVSEKRVATHIYTAEEIVAPLAALEAPMGVVLVPGNHDHWFDWEALQAEAEAAGFIILQNEAAQVGPLAVGGVDDAFTRRDDLSLVLDEMRELDGGRLIVTHSPDITPQVPADVPLVLAGHTHCGQIDLPLIGSRGYASTYGDRYACGAIEENDRTIVVGAGLGTSLLPIRFGTQPEIWVVELRGP